MTSGADTNIDVSKPCKPSAKNHKENLNTRLHNKPRKNNRLQKIALAFQRHTKVSSMQFSTVFAPSISHSVPRARSMALESELLIQVWTC